MSAFLAVKQAEAVQLLTDGAVYNDQGVLVDIKSKVVAVRGLAAAYTLRGEPGLSDLLAVVLGAHEHPYAWAAPRYEFETVDDLLDGFDGALADLRVLLLPRIGERADHYELVLAAVSESRGPGIWFAAGAGEARGPLRAVEGDLIAAPDPGAALLAQAGYVAPESAAAFDVERHGLAFMQAMRLTRANVNPWHHGASEGFGVGGFIEATTVAAAGVTTRVVKRWPDRVGARIVPDLVDEVAVYRNRKERRAAAKQQRRAA